VTGTLLVWLTRALLFAIGAGALVALARWLREALGERRERWAVRVALGIVLLVVVYAAGHARLLLERTSIEEGRAEYARFGDPRLAELRRAETRGWILDCTGEAEHALAAYAAKDGEIDRVYPLGEAGANLIGGGAAADERDFTVERLYAHELRAPKSWSEAGQLHPDGTDLPLTLCRGATRTAWRLLREAGRPGAVVVQDVQTGALVAYAATGGPEQAPFGIRRYAPPGSTFKLALAALWWDAGLPDDTPIPCPASIEVTPRATISNSGGAAYGTVFGPEGMLVPSCNTAAVRMALDMRERLGAQAFEEAYRRFGFVTYADSAPAGTDADFWSTSSPAWARRMGPSPSRLRLSGKTGTAEWAQLAIGQGPIDVTPIAMSRFVQAIGNDGVMLRPTLEAARASKPTEVGRVMKVETSRRLRQAMLEIVDRGTARSVAPRLAGLGGWDLGGKTGTAQIARAPDDGWFAGLIFDPEHRPRYTVVAYLQGGGPGGGRPAAIAAGMTRFFATAARERGD
jgi:cell division protein FtsI/penicillin-binding protein 2